MQTAHAAWRAALAALPPEAPGWNEGSAPPETPAAPSTPPQTAGYGWEGDLAALVANPSYQQIERSKAELARLREQVAAVRDAVYDGEWECRACDTGNKIAARLTEALDKP